MDSEGKALEINLGKRVRYVHCNVTVWSEIRDLFEIARKAFKNRIDVVIANAGLMEKANFLDEHLDGEGNLAEPNFSVLDVNLKGCLNSKCTLLSF